MYLDFGYCIGLIIWICCTHLAETETDLLRWNKLGGYTSKRRMLPTLMPERMVLIVQQITKQRTRVELSYKSGVHFESLLKRTFQVRRRKRDTSNSENITGTTVSPNNNKINDSNNINDSSNDNNSNYKRNDSISTDNENNNTNNTNSATHSERSDNRNNTHISDNSSSSDKRENDNKSDSKTTRKGRTAFAFGNPSLPKKSKRRKPPKPSPLG